MLKQEVHGNFFQEEAYIAKKEKKKKKECPDQFTN